jgi:hypothetical protein
MQATPPILSGATVIRSKCVRQGYASTAPKRFARSRRARSGSAAKSDGN